MSKKAKKAKKVVPEINEAIAKKVLEVVDKGLVVGVGEPVPGEMCVEAAVCYAMGEPHTDKPKCVTGAVRDLKIDLNDSELWRDDQARTKGLRRLAIAQLGSKGVIDGKEFNDAVSYLFLTKYALRRIEPLLKLVADLKSQIDSTAATGKSMGKLRTKLKSKFNINWFALTDTFDGLDADDFLPKNLGSDDLASLNAAMASTGDLGHHQEAKAGEKLIREFCEDVVQILITMKCPGTQYLYLTEVKDEPKPKKAKKKAAKKAKRK